MPTSENRSRQVGFLKITRPAIAATAIALAGIVPCFGADFCVATDGDDSNPGGLESPFATLAKARDAVRGRIAAGLDGNLTVLIRGGYYRLDETVVFGRRIPAPIGLRSTMPPIRARHRCSLPPCRSWGGNESKDRHRRSRMTRSARFGWPTYRGASSVSTRSTMVPNGSPGREEREPRRRKNMAGSGLAIGGRGWSFDPVR